MLLRRLVVLFFVGLLAVAFLVGCGGQEQEEPQVEETAPAVEEQAPATDTAAADTAAVTDTAGGK